MNKFETVVMVCAVCISAVMLAGFATWDGADIIAFAGGLVQIDAYHNTLLIPLLSLSIGL